MRSSQVSDLKRFVAFWSPFIEHLGYEADRWSGGINYGQGDTYLCFLQSPERHRAAGYHRQRVGLNYLKFHGRSRQHVDEIASRVKQAGYALLYEDRSPYAGGPGYYATYCEDPDRIKIEVVDPSEARPATRADVHSGRISCLR